VTEPVIVPVSRDGETRYPCPTCGKEYAFMTFATVCYLEHRSVERKESRP